MECPKCRHLYQRDVNVPLLLIKCGHTLCNSCAKNIFNEKSIRCPECNSESTITSLSSLPKNMALLSIFPAIKSQPKITKGSSKQTISCELHKKEVEAFCMDDLNLLCIDCILVDGHKAHDISPMPQAYDKEKDKLKENIEAAAKVEEKLFTMLTDIENFKTELNSRASEKKECIESMFKEIFRVVYERQKVLKENIENTLKREEDNLISITSQIKDHLGSISSFRESIVKIEEEGVSELLSKARTRKEFAEKVNSPLPTPSFTVNFGEIRRDTELNILWKMLCPQGSIKAGHNLYSTTASYANKKTEKFAVKNRRKLSKKKTAENSPKKDRISQKLSATSKVKAEVKMSKAGNLLKLNVAEEIIQNNPEILALGITDSLISDTDLKDELNSVKAHKTQESNSNPVSARALPNENFNILKQKREKHKKATELSNEALSDILDCVNPANEILDYSKGMESFNDLSESLQRLSCISSNQFEVYNSENDKFAFESFLANEQQFIYTFCTIGCKD